jgi:alkylation response protein AidB-like acyl-CoA dehydrogenase
MNHYHSLVIDDSSAPAADAGLLDLGATIETALRTAPKPPPDATEDEWFSYSVAVQRHLHDYRLVGLEWPEQYGGRALDPVAAAGVMRRLGAAGVPELANYVGIDVLAPVLIDYMDADRLGRWLPAMASAAELGRIEARLNALDALVDTLVRRLADGQALGADAAVSKVLLSRTEQLLYDTSFAWSGDDGLFWDGEMVPHDVQEYLYSIAATIYGGARNIQLNIIAERGLGLPR